MVSNSELRKNARKQLGDGIFTEPWLMMLLTCLIVGFINGALSATFVGSILVLGPLTYGLARCQLNVIFGKNQQADLNDLFTGFKEDFGNTFLLGFLSSLFTALWSLLFVIPGIIKSYSYAMAPYIQQAESDKNWKNCLDKSIAMMKGHKMDLFLLDLSFIGWYIVGALCLGVGMFFVIPYHQMSRANFYAALVADNNVAAE